MSAAHRWSCRASCFAPFATRPVLSRAHRLPSQISQHFQSWTYRTVSLWSWANLAAPLLWGLRGFRALPLTRDRQRDDVLGPGHCHLAHAARILCSRGCSTRGFRAPPARPERIVVSASARVKPPTPHHRVV